MPRHPFPYEHDASIAEDEMKTIDPARIAALMHRERRQFIDNHPKSREFSERARDSFTQRRPVTLDAGMAHSRSTFTPHAPRARR